MQVPVMAPTRRTSAALHPDNYSSYVIEHHLITLRSGHRQVLPRRGPLVVFKRFRHPPLSRQPLRPKYIGAGRGVTNGDEPDADRASGALGGRERCRERLKADG